MAAAIPSPVGALMIRYASRTLYRGGDRGPRTDRSEAYRDSAEAADIPARLNFGDCFAYALARAVGERSCFKGGDFGPHRHYAGT